MSPLAIGFDNGPLGCRWPGVTKVVGLLNLPLSRKPDLGFQSAVAAYANFPLRMVVKDIGYVTRYI